MENSLILGVGSDDKIFIEATDHTLYSYTEWPKSGKAANSIVVWSGNQRFRMALTAENKRMDADLSAPVESYIYNIRYDAWALMDFDGAGNTDKLINFHIERGTNNNNYAAPFCRNFVFPDGTRNCYMPALGHLLIVYRNHRQISLCLSACNAVALNTGSPYSDMFSSTFSGIGVSYGTDSHRRFWSLNTISGILSESSVIANLVVRPFADYYE